MKHTSKMVAVISVICVMLYCVSMVVWGATGSFLTNASCPLGTAGPSCSSCPTEASSVGTGCAWVKINAGPMRPGSSVKMALFRMGENQLSEAVYTPQALSFVAGYAMKGISHEITPVGAPRQVTMVQSAGIPFAFNFKDGETIGVPVFGDAWVMKLRLFMVDANGWAVLKDPAYYDLYTGDGERYRFNAFKASSQYMQLVNHRTVAGREETYQSMGVEVIRDGSQNLRQVLLPSRLADITVTDSAHYSLKFYSLTNVVEGKGTNGYYRLQPNAAPFETWSFANPEPGKLRKLQVTRVMGARTMLYDFTYNADSENWTMTTGDELSVARQEEDVTMRNDARTERLVTRSVKTPDGILVGRYSEQIKSYGWGDGVIRRIRETGGVNQTNLFTYTAAGLTESAIEPDGSWRFFRYDAVGRVTNEISAFMDSPLTAVSSAAHSVVSSYAPVDPIDSPRLNDQLPRTITESITGIVVARTFRVYRQGSNNELQEIVEKALSPSAAYGANGNLRTVTTYYGTNTVNQQIGRINTVAYPDGRMDTYTYEYGTYMAGSGEIPPVFEANSSGNYWRETVVHGTVASPEGMAGKTTKETRILDPMSQEVLAETWICTGGHNYERGTWVSKAYDEWQHPMLVRTSKGEKSEASWGGNCCGKEWEIGADGTELDYSYDLLGRMIRITKPGTTTNTADLVRNYTYDSEGRRLTEILACGSLTQLISSNVYDLAGRLISSVDGQGIATAYGYNGVTNTTTRGGLTNTTVRYLDGKSKSASENGVTKSFSSYGANTSGAQWTKACSGSQGAASISWQKTTVDLLGRTVSDQKPGFGPSVLVERGYEYNTKGQLVKTTATGMFPTLYEYNDLGEQIRSGLDVNDNSGLDLAGPDRLNESATWYEQDGSGDYWQCRASIIYAGDNASPSTNSVQKSRLTGLGSASDLGLLTSDLVSLDLLGNQTASRTYIARNAKTVTLTTTYSDSTNNAEQITINGLLASSISKTGVQTTYAFDTLGRQVAALQGGQRTVGSYTAYNTLGQVASTMDAASNITAYTYDSLGRRTVVTDALGNSTYTSYDVDGRVLASWGATYPVAYEYDEFGRMTAMYTYRGTNALISYSEISNQKSEMDRTTWSYDQATGLLTNKLYADGRGPAYSYTPDGKLARRTWARGVTTDYNYDPLGQMTNIDYSDATPDVTFTFNRLGQQATITDGQGIRSFTYNDAMQLIAETNSMGVLQFAFDSQGRSAGFSAGSDYSVQYGYSSVGRFASLTSVIGPQSSVFSYSFVPGSDLVVGYTNDSGYGVVRTYEANRNLITSIVNGMGGVQLRRFGYVNDAVGRRVQRADVEISTVISNLFAYNTRSELTGALMDTNTFSYQYDSIGNRVTATNNAEAFAYAANTLNQYSQISNQQSQITPSYDSDGNIVTNGVWTYVWDAENRLVSAASNGQSVATFAYDYMSRRYRKTTSALTNTFIYNGWAMIQERLTSDDSPLTNSFVYGLDLSGTAQGAGTIGGILSAALMTNHQSPITCFYCYDANGNVTDLVGTNGQYLAKYQFDPYGNTIAKSGDLADVNPFKFSTKYCDAETGFYYYGYRYYQPECGRWPSRDPIEDPGFLVDYVAYAVPGIGLYTFVRNDAANLIDPLGLSEWRLDLTDHGGPHIQLGDYRWDARTLEPIPHKGITPPKLTPSQMKELAKSGVLDDVLRKVPNSVVKEAGEELFGDAFKNGTKCLSKSAQKQLAKSILKKIPVILLIFAATDYAEGGVEKAVKNAVIPGDLIEDVLKDSSKRYDEWSDAAAKAIWEKRCKCAGLDPKDLE